MTQCSGTSPCETCLRLLASSKVTTIGFDFACDIRTPLTDLHPFPSKIDKYTTYMPCTPDKESSIEYQQRYSMVESLCKGSFGLESEDSPNLFPNFAIVAESMAVPNLVTLAVEQAGLQALSWTTWCSLLLLELYIKGKLGGPRPYRILQLLARLYTIIWSASLSYSFPSERMAAALRALKSLAYCFTQLNDPEHQAIIVVLEKYNDPSPKSTITIEPDLRKFEIFSKKSIVEESKWESLMGLCRNSIDLEAGRCSMQS